MGRVYIIQTKNNHRGLGEHGVKAQFTVNKLNSKLSKDTVAQIAFAEYKEFQRKL